MLMKCDICRNLVTMIRSYNEQFKCTRCEKMKSFLKREIEILKKQLKEIKSSPRQKIW